MRLRGLLSHVRVAQKLPFLLGKYVYQPLPTSTSIRLLELLPSADKNRIRCSLSTFELDDAPAFKALSYTWGRASISIKQVVARGVHHEKDAAASSLNDADSLSRTRRHYIICDDRLMKVTSNLRDALRMLGNSIDLPMMPKTPSYYWVDALCVDQENVLERNSQVARMAEVFRKATGVIVWLGRADEYTADALEVIHRVSAIPESDWPLVPYTSFYDPNAVGHSPKPNLTYHNWLGFIALINRPWFQRAWVSQLVSRLL